MIAVGLAVPVSLPQGAPVTVAIVQGNVPRMGLDFNEQRKAAGLEIADRIRVRLGATARVEAAAHAHRDWIAREVLAVELEITALFDAGTTFELDGDTVTLELVRA